MINSYFEHVKQPCYSVLLSTLFGSSSPSSQVVAFPLRDDCWSADGSCIHALLDESLKASDWPLSEVGAGPDGGLCLI